LFENPNVAQMKYYEEKKTKKKKKDEKKKIVFFLLCQKLFLSMNFKSVEEIWDYLNKGYVSFERTKGMQVRNLVRKI